MHDVLVRLPPIFCTLLTALCGTLLPIWMDFSTKMEKYVFRYGNAVAAGVLGAAGFVHMFPDATETLGEVYDTKFPVAGAIALAGAQMMFLMDNVLQTKTVRNCLPFDGSNGYLSEDVVAQLEPSATKKHKQKSPGLVMYMLFAALSFHSIFEGLAMGANARFAQKFYAILWAILAHKFFAALSLGISLARNAKQLSLKRRITLAIFFSVMTPLGALIGLYFGTAYEEGSVHAKSVRGSLTAFSAGIFIYVCLVEIVADEFFGHHHHNSSRVSAMPSRGGSHRCLQEYVHRARGSFEEPAATQDHECMDHLHHPLIWTQSSAVHLHDDDEHLWSRVGVLLASASAMTALAAIV
eukprot:Plantae.Rhodophyta-Purpureofilum_apyrenoidigerum.ctg1112.p1 GENE.Plantae.Rhodophyta-Purpureofilum_apyrenoidigerum.ctg1112~~Plantae.Rhodophyta-Purpureofilum_apyrenoidigerum.ctg1112.p1  ORF type:complete len:353 (-),score=46.85 Plantae.Rhodophyta-Purpureofilum_apyrenoidigerum.ctg1112:614-1672(-)